MASIPRKYKHVNLIHNLCDIHRKPYMFKALKMWLYFVVINHFVKNKCYKMLYISIFSLWLSVVSLDVFFAVRFRFTPDFPEFGYEREKAEVKHSSLLNRTETTACLPVLSVTQSKFNKKIVEHFVWFIRVIVTNLRVKAHYEFAAFLLCFSIPGTFDLSKLWTFYKNKV